MTEDEDVTSWPEDDDPEKLRSDPEDDWSEFDTAWVMEEEL
jgi:hypothetical protein